MNDYKCDQCNADLRDSEIPESHRDSYGSATHFSRRIGIYSLDRDMTVAYRCPDCGAVQCRFCETINGHSEDCRG